MTRRLPQLAKDAGKALRTARALRQSLEKLQTMDPYLHGRLLREAGSTPEQFHERMTWLEDRLKDVRERAVKR